MVTLLCRDIFTGEVTTVSALSAGDAIEYARNRAHAAAHRGDGNHAWRVEGDDREYCRTPDGRTRVTRDNGTSWVI